MNIKAIAAVGLAGLAVFATAGTASAMPGDHLCTANEVTAKLVAGDPGAGQRYANVQFTAKPDRGCSLQGAQPVSLAGAPGIDVTTDRGQGKLVTIANGESASMLLHWSGINAPAQQVTPSAVKITLAHDTFITLPWNQGPLDDSQEAHGLRVSAVQPGAAQY